MFLATLMGVAGAAMWLWMQKRPAHERSRAHVRKQRAKLRAFCRRSLRAPKYRGKEYRRFRHGVQQLLKEPTEQRRKDVLKRMECGGPMGFSCCEQHGDRAVGTETCACTCHGLAEYEDESLGERGERARREGAREAEPMLGSFLSGLFTGHVFKRSAEIAKQAAGKRAAEKSGEP